MLLNTPFLALATLGATIAQAATTTGKPSNTYTIKNFKTVNQYGMTVLTLTFADPKDSTFGGNCSLTMTHRQEEDSCGWPSSASITTTRNGVNADWPMNVTLAYYDKATQTTYQGSLTLAGPGTKGSKIVCKTVGGVQTCTSASNLSVGYSPPYNPDPGY